jgi:hypothetical protein
VRNSPIVILAPLVALADQSAAYALVEWSCGRNNTTVPAVVHLVFLTVAIAMTLVGWRQCRASTAGGRSDAAAATQHLIAWVGMAAAALSALVIAMMGVGAIVLSPCIN